MNRKILVITALLVICCGYASAAVSCSKDFAPNVDTDLAVAAGSNISKEIESCLKN